jgi:uncharacterized protein YggE
MVRMVVRRAALALSILGLASAGCAATPAVLNVYPSALPEGISVTGEGEAHAAPTLAYTTLGVEIRAPRAEQAIAGANDRMARVLAALRQAGVADRDLRTTGFSVVFEQRWDEPPSVPLAPPPPVPASPPRGSKDMATSAPAIAHAYAPAPAPDVLRGEYVVRNSVMVTVRDVAQLGGVISVATNAGANEVQGVSMEIEDPAPLVAAAREEATKDAQQKAARLAQLLGVKLGPVVSVSDEAGGAPYPMAAPMVRAMEAKAVPIEAGELTVSRTVRLTYAIDGSQ